MRIDPIKALIAYAGVTTAAIAYALVTAAAPLATASFASIDVGRINVREPDGTIRMILSSAAQAPGIIVRNKEHPHPTRQSAGLLFYNQQGSENGGLIFDGKLQNGKPVGGGSLTFDRYEQDQVVQMVADEDGAKRTAGFKVFDRPDKRMDFDMIDRAAKLPADQRAAFYSRAGVGGHNRLFAGRSPDGSSTVALRDGAGRERLVMAVSDAGAARIDFLDAAGEVVKSVTP
ncbi:hypothetical protein EAH79_09605 [Sphingomonas koreensis]|nr:hypothetical protein EAH79_09605 [Sphingomonas koreensis]